MTANPNAGKLTLAAQQMLERYLYELRLALRGCASVDLKEVESDVRQHIDQELAEQPAPVSGEQLGAILNKLGSPTQWVPIDELPWWRRMMIRLRMGPVSDRWAMTLFAIFILGLMLVPAMGFGLILIFASFLLARATLAMCNDAGEELRWRRWLVYPPMVVIYLFLASSLLGWPTSVGPLVDDLSRPHARGTPEQAAIGRHMRTPLFLTFITVASLGAWWTLLAASVIIWKSWPAAVFHPFIGVIPRWGGWLLLLGSLLVTAMGVSGILVWVYD